MKKKAQSRRAFLKATAMSVTVAQISGCAAKLKGIGSNGSKPNLLFLLTDQQRFDALSYAGNKVLHTPNLDRLAREGVWFENAHAQCAVCESGENCWSVRSRIATKPAACAARI